MTDFADDERDRLRTSAFEGHGHNPAETFRPSLVRLTEDVREELHNLMVGFESRRELLEWAQRLTVRTLGAVDDVVYLDLWRALRAPDQERVLLGVLLDDAEILDRHGITHSHARETRRRIAADRIMPAAHAAFRSLRKDAGEYVDDAQASQHDPMTQRYIAMRPALDELDDRQADVLERVLEGFDEPEEILDWAGREVDLATHGEIPDEFSRRCYKERSTRMPLLADDDRLERVREAFAAKHLVPAFNRGVRVLAGRASEMPHKEATDQSPLNYEDT